MTTTLILAPPGVSQKPALEADRLTRGGSVPAEHADGFGGARDAAILAAGHYYGCKGLSVIQATARTADLLRRAGFRGVKRHAFYEVPVEKDRLGRMQIASREDFQS